MKKIIFSILSFFLLFSYTYANGDLRDYFILDKWHDLGEVKPYPSWYYVPNITYTDWESVKNKFISNYDYIWDFYKKHFFKKDFINWKNNDSYFYVNWDTPVVFSDISTIRTITKKFYFSYRKDWKIEWKKWSSLPEWFLSWYNSKKNKVIILYPIKEKLTWYTRAFVQYPCWNLVCKNQECSALKENKKNYKCEIKFDKETIYDNENIELNLSKNYKELKLKSLYVNWKKIVSTISKDRYPINKPKPWIYEVKVTANHPITKKEIYCKSKLKVLKSAKCWDNIIDKLEQCDDWNFKNWDWCNSSCKLETPTCSIEPKYSCVENWEKFKNIFIVNKANWILNKIYVGNKSVDKEYSFYKSWYNNVSLHYINSLNSNVKNICSAKIKIRSKAFCGDGILNNGEVCDPNDSLTGIFCTKSCNLKKPNKCGIHISWDLIAWKKVFIWASKDFYSKINWIIVNWKEIKTSNANYWIFTFPESWNYQIKLNLWNRLNWLINKSCIKEIQITNEDPCR